MKRRASLETSWRGHVAPPWYNPVYTQLPFPERLRIGVAYFKVREHDSRVRIP